MNKEDLGKLFEEYIGTISESIEGYKDPNYYYTDATGYKVIQSICDSLNNYYKKDFLISGFKFDVYKRFGPNMSIRYGNFDKRSSKSDGIYIYIEFPKELKQTEYTISLELGETARYNDNRDKYEMNVSALKKLINLYNDRYSKYHSKVGANSIVCYKTDNYSLIFDIIEHIKNNYYVPLLEQIGLKDAYWKGEEWENFQKNTFGNNYMPIKKSESSSESRNKIDKEDENLYKESQIQKDNAIKNGFNRLYYGVPGCGKSWYIENHLKEIVGASDKEDIIKIRTVFYSDYSNSDFVGQILPVNEGDKLVYKPIPGPFTKALKSSLENINNNKKIVLIIEEINRGNASAIFGDIFQLLDREDNIYIDNNFINQYAKLKGNELLNNFIIKNGIKLPNNLYIIGTMNTSDQNVYTLDTAFKRRWDMKYWSNQFNEKDEIGDCFIPNSNGVSWANFVNKINDAILNKSNQIMQGEDKQLGKYFISKNYLIENKKNDELIGESLKNYCYDFNKFEKFRDKVLVYLFDDVTKYNHGSLFLDDINSIDKLMSKNKLEEIIKVSFDNE